MHAVHVGVDMRPRRALRIEADAGVATQEHAERNPGFQPGQWGAQAEMNALAKPEMGVGVTPLLILAL